MYCINCGVELAEHEKKCPLCGTEVIYPEFIKNAPAPFPENKTVYRELNRNGFLFIISFLFFTAAALTFICDLSRSQTIVWSGYAAGGIALGYIIIILPMWFKKESLCFFLPPILRQFFCISIISTKKTTQSGLIPLPFPSSCFWQHSPAYLYFCADTSGKKYCIYSAEPLLCSADLSYSRNFC